MYITDNKYRELIASNNRNGYVTGTLTTNSNVSVLINDAIIADDSLKITNQSVNDTSFNLGTVYAAELSVTLVTDIDRYALYNGYIELIYHIGEYSIPLGVFNITEADRVGKKISVRACDNMLKFDVDVTEDITGTMWELISYISKKCGVELAQTETQIKAFTNTSDSNIYAVLAERVQTYRDAISCMATVMCCFATINREGKLIFKQYSAKSDYTVTNTDRFEDAEFSDYNVKFKGILGRFIANENYWPYKHIDVERDGLILNAGDIPIVAGTDDFKHEIIDNMWETIKDINYVPCNIKIKPDAALELGDMFSNTCINNDSAVSTVNYVQYYQWNYRRPMVVKCVGDNARLASVKNKQNKEMANIENSISNKQTVVISYTNAKELKILADETDIITINYTIVSDCKPIFTATVPYVLSGDGIVTYSYYLDNALVENRTVSSYRLGGNDFSTLVFSFDAVAGTRKTLKVKAKVEYIESEKRISDAKQATLTNRVDAISKMLESGTLASVQYDTVKTDTTQPIMTIGEASILALSYAQGLSQEAANWDGMLDIEEEFNKITVDIPTIKIKDFAETVTAAMQVPKSSSITEIFNKIDIDIPDISISGVDTLTYLTDKTGVILTDKVGNKLTERGKNE